MTRSEIITLCLTFPAAFEDYPFDDKWAVMRHRTNRKGFAFIYELNGVLCVNLKCDPLEGDVLRGVYKDILPGYHMNKKHWITVRLGGDVPDEELCSLIGRSYGLIKPKKRVRSDASQSESGGTHA